MKPFILHGHTRPIKNINFSSNGKLVYSASVDRTIISWDVDKKEKLFTFQHGAALNCFTLSFCGKYLVSGDSTGNVYIWDTETKEVIVNLEGNPLELVKSIFINDSFTSLLISFAGRGKTSPSRIKCIDLKELIEKKLTCFQKEKEQLYDLKDEEYYSSMNDGHNEYYESEYSGQSIYTKIKGSLKTDSFNQKEKKKKKPNQNGNLNQNQNLNINHNLNSLNSNSKLQEKISIDKTKILFDYLSLKSKFVKACFIQNDKCILAAKEDGFLEIINTSTGDVLVEKSVHTDTIMDMDVSEKLRYILTASLDGFCCLTSLDTLEILHKFYPLNPTRNINCCRIMEIQNPFKNSKKVNVDDLFNEESNDADILDDKFIKLRKKDILSLAIFSGGQDSKLVTTTHKDEGGFEIIGHDLETGLEVLNLVSHFGPVNTLGCLPNSPILSSGSEDSSVRLYNIEEIISEKHGN